MAESPTKKQPKIKRSRLRCKKCNTILESKHGHDYVTCGCGVMLDGGKNYVRCGWPEGKMDDWIEFMTEYEDETSI